MEEAVWSVNALVFIDVAFACLIIWNIINYDKYYNKD
tara:strand:- start:119 stop:229 length:111 start_codon:yes stop_codon:yes gene_type:complete